MIATVWYSSFHISIGGRAKSIFSFFLPYHYHHCVNTEEIGWGRTLTLKFCVSEP